MYTLFRVSVVKQSEWLKTELNSIDKLNLGYINLSESKYLPKDGEFHQTALGFMPEIRSRFKNTGVPL